jgi:hypothetical protein
VIAMNLETEIEMLKKEIAKANENKNRLVVLSLTGRLNGLLMRQDNKMAERIGNLEAAMKVVNAAHQAMIHAINSGDMREVKNNGHRIRAHLISAFATLGFVERIDDE